MRQPADSSNPLSKQQFVHLARRRRGSAQVRGPLRCDRRRRRSVARRTHWLFFRRKSRATLRAWPRSAVSPSPFLRGPSPNCDQTKTQATRPGSSFRADSLQPLCRLFGGRTCVMFVRSTEARMQELRRLCPLFADRTQEGDTHTGLGPTWQCPVLGIADERADMQYRRE